MTPGRLACALTVFAVLCVLALFFFPGMEGPYSAVHGPVTALLSLRAAAMVRFAIVRTGLTAIRGCLRTMCMRLVLLSWSAFVLGESRIGSWSEASSSILRC